MSHSALYIGRVTHHRFRPIVHRLAYRVFWLLLDVDEIAELSQTLRVFSCNRFNLFSFYDKDYVGQSDEPLRPQIERYLQAAGLDPDGGAIRLLTMPRILGYGFNPISVFFCYRRDESLRAILYEVHNTFGQRHSYLIPVTEGAGLPIRQSCTKALYVSPFIDMAMTYDFRVIPPVEKAMLTIVARDADGILLTAALKADRTVLSDLGLVRAFIALPLLTLKVTLGIHWEALLLWLKKVRLVPRPPPPEQPVSVISPPYKKLFPHPIRNRDNNTMTSDSQSNRSTIARPRRGGFARFLLSRLLQRMDAGHLIVTTPSGEWVEYKSPLAGASASVTLHRWRAIRRLAMRGDMGFAESYIEGDWSSHDLTAFMLIATHNGERFKRMIAGLLPARFANRWQHRRRANTKTGSRRNITFHYDLGNAFYKQWLDPSMTYSSALYAHPAQSLEAAQDNKLSQIVADLDVKADCKVLEIGCGWGALAVRLANAGAVVTGLTLSSEQLAHANKLVEEAGLSSAVTLKLQDYRDCDGLFDRIVSIEMFEAVGESYWPTYFDTLRQRLKPGGKAVLQVITIDESRYDDYRKTPDFIQRYIFPGGMLPTKAVFTDHAHAVGLSIASMQSFGESYALTLAEWRRRFLAAWPSIEAMGFPLSFRRLWEYYLCYCEAGFRAGTIDVSLYVLEG